MRCSPVSQLLFALPVAVLLYGRPASAAPRPVEIILLQKGPATFALKDIVYAPGTPDDISRVAAGTANAVVTLFGKTVTHPIKFENLLFDATGKPTGIGIQVETDTTYEDLLSTGCDLFLPKDTRLTYALPQTLTVVGDGAKLVLPFRSENGKPVAVSAKNLSVKSDASGLTLGVKQALLLGTGDITLAGFTVKASGGINATMTAPAAVEAKGTLQFDVPIATLTAELPGLPTAKDKPIKASVTDLKLDQDGDLTFSKATIDPGAVADLLQPSDWRLTIKSGDLTMTDGVLVGFNVVVDLRLPPEFSSTAPPSAPQPVTIKGIALDVRSGTVVAVNKPLDLYWKGLSLRTTGFTVDLSPTVSAASPPAIKSPAWMGLFIASGTLDLPPALGGTDATATTPSKPATLAVSNFMVENGGISGTVAVGGGAISSVAGFKATGITGNIKLNRSRLTECNLSGSITLPVTAGKSSAVKVNVGVSDDGFVSVAAAPNAKLPLEAFGAEIALDSLRFEATVPRGETPIGKIFVSGSLAFPTISEPVDLRNARLTIQSLGFDSEGKVYLPTDGQLRLGKPLVLELGPGSLQVDSVGFETKNNKLDAVEIEGDVRLAGDLPVSGGVQFEGLKIASGANNLPEITVGGVGVDVNIDGIVSGSGELLLENDRNDATFKQFDKHFYGRIAANLDCLAGAGLDMQLMVSEKGAWFLGAGVSFAGIPVPPPTPNSAPMFALYGFTGGFGFNVLPKSAGQGRITAPDQLRYVQSGGFGQAGLLLGDPAGGFVWWGEAMLTVGMPPLFIELDGQATLMTLERPKLVDADFWDTQDRTAHLFANLQFDPVVFLAGLEGDFFFPTRGTSLASLSGDAEFKLSKDQKYLRVGWPHQFLTGMKVQRPVTLELAKVAGKIVNVTAKGGMYLDLQSDRGGLFFDISATFLDGLAKGNLKGDLAVSKLAQAPPNANGKLIFTGSADFAPLSLKVNGNLNCDLKTRSQVSTLTVDGDITGSIRTMFGTARHSVGFDLTLSNPKK